MMLDTAYISLEPNNLIGEKLEELTSLQILEEAGLSTFGLK